MVSGLLVAVLVSAIAVMLIIKFVPHKLFAIIIVLVLLFLYFSGSYFLSDGEIDITTGEGVLDVATLYIGWMGHLYTNIRTLTGRAIEMDWEGNLNESIDEK